MGFDAAEKAQGGVVKLRQASFEFATESRRDPEKNMLYVHWGFQLLIEHDET
jgi:hypothetical protein